MRNLSTEMKVGIFAIVVLSILTYMTFRVSGTDWFRKAGYTVYVYFSNVAGLDEKTRVKIAGVDAGLIEEIQLEKGRARVTLRILPHVKIYQDARAFIKATGLLGDKYLEIRPGTAEPALKDGDTIRNVREPIDMEEIVYNLVSVSKSIQSLSDNINDIFGTEETKKALRETAKNLSLITKNLNRVITENDERLKETLNGIKALTASLKKLIDENSKGITTTVDNLRETTTVVKKEAPELIKKLDAAATELKRVIEENRPRIASLTEKADETLDSVSKIAKKIEKGEGTLGKLVNDERLYESVSNAAEGVEKTISRIDRFRTYITFRGEYLSKPKDGKGYFYLTLKPRPDKYYILGVVGDPIGKVTTTEKVTTINGVTTVEKEETVEKKVEFTAQFAKRFKNIALRIGLTENTFGFGVDHFLLNDKLTLRADVWDFGNDEEGSKNPHLKIGVDYNIYKGIFLSGGVDNILNSKWRGLYLGGGITFEDEDFKYLFGTVPRMPVK